MPQVQPYSQMIAEQQVVEPQLPAEPAPVQDEVVIPDMSGGGKEGEEQQLPIAAESAEIPKETEKADDVEMAEYSIDVPDGMEQQADEIKPINYKEIFEKADDAAKKEILESIGIDPFALSINEHIKKGGRAEDYLTAKAVDWAKVPHEKLVIEDLKKQYPTLSDEKIHKLFNGKYKQGENYSEDENEIGALEMEGIGEQIRARKIQEAENFKMPEVRQQEQPKQNNFQEQYINYIAQSEVTKEIQQSKRVAVDTGFGVVNIPISNPSLLADIITNRNGMAARYGVDKQGYPDVQLTYEMALLKANPEAFKKALVDKGMKLERSKTVEEGQHIASKSTQQISSTPRQNEKEAWAKSAKVVPYSQLGHL